MSESTFNDSSVGTVGSRAVAYTRQYKRTNERNGTPYSTRLHTRNVCVPPAMGWVSRTSKNKGDKSRMRSYVFGKYVHESE
jgi:hypothetical protein